jgi:uncharacterized membrane protein YedE/YeeE
VSALAAFLAGAIFALGLVVARMTDPGRVLAFLDVTGDWDPRLAGVMAAAVLVYAVAARFALRVPPVLREQHALPTRRKVDGRLVAGAAIFGIGWGVAGYCPGPAVTALGGAAPGALTFVAAMLLGMWLQPRVIAPESRS